VRRVNGGGWRGRSSFEFGRGELHQGRKRDLGDGHGSGCARYQSPEQVVLPNLNNHLKSLPHLAIVWTSWGQYSDMIQISHSYPSQNCLTQIVLLSYHQEFQENPFLSIEFLEVYLLKEMKKSRIL